MTDPTYLTEAYAALRQSPVFGPLPADQIERIAKSVRLERFKNPTLIVAAGEKSDCLRYVLQGQINFQAHSRDGDFVELRPTGAGHWMSWLGTFSTRNAEMDSWSSKDAEYLAFPNKTLLAVANDNPEMYQRVFNEIAVRFQSVLSWLWNSSLLDGERKIASLLLFYSGGAPPRQEITITATQEAMSKFANCSRQKVNRLLSDLETRNFIKVGYGSITITDLNGLRRFAMGEIE